MYLINAKYIERDSITLTVTIGRLRMKGYDKSVIEQGKSALIHGNHRQTQHGLGLHRSRPQCSDEPPLQSIENCRIWVALPHSFAFSFYYWSKNSLSESWPSSPCPSPSTCIESSKGSNSSIFIIYSQNKSPDGQEINKTVKIPIELKEELEIYKHK